MQSFIINQNQQPNGDHEVHNTTAGCIFMPLLENQISLGSHLTCTGAVAEARTRWTDVRINGCYFCCAPCHTT